MSSLEGDHCIFFNSQVEQGKVLYVYYYYCPLLATRDNPLSRVNYLSDNRDLMDRIDSGKTQDKVFAVYNNHPWHWLSLSEPHSTLPEPLLEIGRGFVRLCGEIKRGRGMGITGDPQR